MESRKITLKDFTFSSRQIINDLRALQGTGLTLPDIIYNYRIEEGHLVRKRYREGSVSGDEDEEEETQEQKDKTRDDFLNAGRESREHDKNEAGSAKGKPEVKIHRKAVPVYSMEEIHTNINDDLISQGGPATSDAKDTAGKKAKKPRKKVGFGGAEVIPSSGEPGTFERVETVGRPHEKKGNFVGEQMSGIVER